MVGGLGDTGQAKEYHPSQPSLLESGRHRIRGVWLDREDWRPSWKEQTLPVLWLHKLVDNKEATYTLTIWKTNNKDRLLQNVVDSPDDAMTLDKVGEVTFTAKFKAGIDEAHEEFLDGHNQWCTFKAWKAARESGEPTGRTSQ